MADPFTIAAVVGGGAKVLGGIAQTNTRVGQLKAQSAADAENARRASLEAGATYSVGARNEEQARRDYRGLAGAQAAAVGEGALSATGSVLDIIRQSEARASLDALRIRYDATSRGQALEEDSRNLRMQSQLARTMAKRTRLAGSIATIGNLAGAGSDIYSAANLRPRTKSP